jgi:hypothetical protein
MDLRGLVDPASGFLREQMSGFHDFLRQKTHLSAHIVAIELNFNGLPKDVIMYRVLVARTEIL